VAIEELLQHQPIPGRAVYVDMNSFFASVEQELHPELRGQPVGVCPFVNDATCVIAASVEAKRYGVRTGTRVSEARRLCPDIHLTSGQASTYRWYHHKIMKALETTRCQVIVKSIDEAHLVLPSDLRPEAVTIGHEVKRLTQEVGPRLGCSVGIASNMFLAKMGTKLHKPYGMVEIHLADLEAFYSTLGLTDLYGISWRMAVRLERLGITTPLAFYQASYARLKQAFGVNGERWYLRLRGYEVDERTTTRRMIGHQTTIVPDPARTTKAVLEIAGQLTYKAAVRLRAAELAATGVQVAVRFTDRSWWKQTIQHLPPFWDSRSFFDHVEQAFSQWTPPKPVRLVSVSAVNLMPRQATTMPLFTSPLQSERLSVALDEIDQRFGRATITPASHLLQQQLVDRVGFGNAGHAAAELDHQCAT
jgi:DNA polymerase-4